MSSLEPLSTPPRPQNRWWLWFFLFVAVASVGVAAFMIWFNNRLQLSPAKLEAAMERWSKHGPSSYTLVFQRQIKDAPAESFVVRVRKRKAIEVRRNGELLRDENNQPLPAGHERLQWFTMEQLFREIEIFLEQDAREGRKVYNVATFDAQTGALELYRRSDRVKNVSITEQIKVEPLAD